MVNVRVSSFPWIVDSSLSSWKHDRLNSCVFLSFSIFCIDRQMSGDNASTLLAYGTELRCGSETHDDDPPGETNNFIAWYRRRGIARLVTMVIVVTCLQTYNSATERCLSSNDNAGGNSSALWRFDRNKQLTMPKKYCNYYYYFFKSMHYIA